MGLAAEHGFYPELVEWVGSFLSPLTRKNKEKECAMDSSRLTMTRFFTPLPNPLPRGEVNMEVSWIRGPFFYF